MLRSRVLSRGTLLLLLLVVSNPLAGIATPALAEDVVLVGAGDIAGCGRTSDEATAALLDIIPGTIFTAGDNAYPDGTDAQFAQCYQSSWGRYKGRTRPSLGNHDYGTPAAAGYFNYFGSAAGDPSKGYYSYDLGAWHIVVVNSNCSEIGGCQAGSEQEQWLRADLAAHPTTCTLAYWHHPRFSSGTHGSNLALQPIWQALYDFGADVVLNGHDHDYERFASQDPAGNADTRGIRQFVIGTGGTGLRGFGTPIANSQVRYSATHGVLKLILQPTSYNWQFIPTTGTFSDTGSSICVDRPPDTPVITSLEPSSATANGADFALTVHGSNFASDANVRWNGEVRPTSFVSSVWLTATISAADIAAPGTAEITIYHPMSGSISNAHLFTIANAPSESLLLNGGFEEDANPVDGKPDGWTIKSPFARSATVVHTGSYAGQHFATNNAGYTVYQTISNLSAGTTYNFSGWVTILPTSDSFTFKIQVRWINSIGGTISTKTVRLYNGPTDSWTQATANLTAPTGTSQAQVRMTVGSLNGTIYVDDFVFRAP